MIAVSTILLIACSNLANLLLALAGGALGFVFSQWLANALMAMTSAPGFEFDMKLEPTVMLDAVALSVATGLSFGLAAALPSPGDARQRPGPWPHFRILAGA